MNETGNFRAFQAIILCNSDIHTYSTLILCKITWANNIIKKIKYTYSIVHMVSILKSLFNFVEYELRLVINRFWCIWSCNYRLGKSSFRNNYTWRTTTNLLIQTHRCYATDSHFRSFVRQDTLPFSHISTHSVTFAKCFRHFPFNHFDSTKWLLFDSFNGQHSNTRRKPHAHTFGLLNNYALIAKVTAVGRALASPKIMPESCWNECVNNVGSGMKGWWILASKLPQFVPHLLDWVAKMENLRLPLRCTVGKITICP